MDGQPQTETRIICEDEIHDFRKEIDANIKKAQEFSKCNFGNTMGATGKRENALVITKLQEAKMWAGKILEEMNAPFPEELRDEAGNVPRDETPNPDIAKED